jgi:hypothetical protein
MSLGAEALDPKQGDCVRFREVNGEMEQWPCTCGLDALLALPDGRDQPQGKESDSARPPSVVSDEQATAGTNEVDR